MQTQLEGSKPLEAPKLKMLRLNTREVSQLDGLQVRWDTQYFDEKGMLRCFVYGYYASMLFWPDEIEECDS